MDDCLDAPHKKNSPPTRSGEFCSSKPSGNAAPPAMRGRATDGTASGQSSLLSLSVRDLITSSWMLRGQASYFSNSMVYSALPWVAERSSVE